jgi:AGCS family alanine or glycine:cation symporter
MATKYAEGFLAIRYRTIDDENHVLGGPFYYIENGMGKKMEMACKAVCVLRSMRRTFGNRYNYSD